MIKKIKDFYNKFYDRDLVHFAASLSFYTMLSIIPLLLLSFTIFTQLPSFEEYLDRIKSFIFESLLPSHQEIISQYLEQFLSNSLNLGLIGFVAIIFSTTAFFDNYKYVVKKLTTSLASGFWQDFSKYWTLITLAPLGLGLSFYLSAKFQILLNQTELTKWINLAIFLPYIIIWAIFAIVYKISINKQTSNKFILFSSFITSLAWNGSKFAFIKYTFYNKTYTSIYGSFSILLFFLLWIYISWIIFLYGFKIYTLLDEKNGNDTKNREQNSY